jgi:hypothetical protein
VKTFQTFHSETVTNRDSDAIIISCETLDTSLLNKERKPLTLSLLLAPSDTKEQTTMYLSHEEARSLVDALSRMIDYSASPDRFESSG